MSPDGRQVAFNDQRFGPSARSGRHGHLIGLRPGDTAHQGPRRAPSLTAPRMPIFDELRLRPRRRSNAVPPIAKLPVESEPTWAIRQPGQMNAMVEGSSGVGSGATREIQA